MYSTIKKYQVNDTEYTFICRSRSTRSGFAHDAELQTANGYVIGTASCHYLNRTWESYEYQSVMIRVVVQKLEEYLLCAREQFKREHNISRITAKRKPEMDAFVAAQFEKTNSWKELRELLTLIK